MFSNFILILICLIVIDNCCAYSTEIVDFQLGETKVQIVTDTYASRGGATTDCKPLAFLNLHADEIASVVAARKLLDDEPCGGRITRIAHGKSLTRLVSFVIGGQTFSFDPNRIFNGAGVRYTLQNSGRTSAAAEAATSQFAAKILQIYGFDTIPMAFLLHNTGGVYGAHYYKPGGSYADEAKQVLIRGGTSSFAFLTKQTTFDCMKNSDATMSLVLQSPEIAQSRFVVIV
jgi:hypothetical protein